MDKVGDVRKVIAQVGLSQVALIDCVVIYILITQIAVRGVQCGRVSVGEEQSASQGTGEFTLRTRAARRGGFYFIHESKLNLNDTCFVEKTGTQQKSSSSDKLYDLDGSRLDVRAIWHLGASDLVGILLGYYGAGYLFCYVRHDNGNVCLLLCY